MNTNLTERLANVIISIGESLLNEPMCQIYLVLALTYLLEMIVTLRWGHRAACTCQGLVVVAYLAAAVVHGLPHP
jgi:hypothetical protein